CKTALYQYVSIFLKSDLFISQLRGFRGTTTINQLTQNNFNDFWIPIPPANEQKRIVEKLQNVSPFIVRYSKSQDALHLMNMQIIEQLKKSVLQEAIQGKLVPQDPNDEPASVLLERIRAEKAKLVKEKKIKKDKNESIIYRGEDNSYYEKFLATGEVKCIDEEIPFEIPKGWEWERWGNISQSIQYGYNAPALEKGVIRMVRISDIQDNKVFWNNVPFCMIEEKDIETYLLEINDILFARTGGTVGKSFLVEDVPMKSIYAGYLIRTRYSSLLCPHYMKAFMESQLYWDQLKNGTIATAQPNCNGKTLAKMLLPIPPINEQKRIVEILHRISPFIERYSKSQDALHL
ncbi:MAG: restriction endonuclease subunit S, partial [Marinifilaceae bacterium]|nr:restriction endonuclease subunit S [Marinifilaceae bacterium]